MKKSIIGILVLCLLVCFQSVFADGTCGTNVKYTVSGDTIDFSRNDSAADAVWGTNCKTAISGNSAVTKITVSEPIRVTNAVAMFRDLSNITEMDLENLDVSGATDMYEMFKGCSKLSTLNVATWDTSNVTDMYEMFSSCSSLDSLDVSNWDISKVVHMHGMFSGCRILGSLDVRNWDTSSVTDMSDMFSGCSDLGFDSGYSTDFLDISNWDTSNVTDMSNMFYGCRIIYVLSVNAWDTSNVINMSGMFAGCNNLRSLDVSGWDTSNVTDMSKMFYNCHTLNSLDVSAWDTSNVTNISEMFYYCHTLTGLDVSGWNTSRVTDMSGMFHWCSSLNNLNVSDWDTSNVVNMFDMFSECSNLTGLDVSSWNTSNVTNMGYMFHNCSSLNSLNLSNWDTSNVSGWTESSYIGYMFWGSGVTRFTFGKKSLNGYVYAMFDNFSRRDQRWYYIAAGPEASSPLPLGSFKENGVLFNQYDPNTMAGTWATISSLSIMSPAGVDVSDQRVITSEETCRLTVSIDPTVALQKAEWTSSRIGIAEVDQMGKVTFKSPGTVTITATAPNSGGIKAEMELTYSPSAPVLSIRNADNEDVTGQTLRITGDTIQLIGSMDPADGVFSAAWTVSDPDIAEVGVTGKVTFLTPGMVTAGYTVTAEDGTLQFASVKLTNQPLAEEVKIKDADGNDISAQTVTVRTTEYQLSASTLPADAAQQFTWTSSDTSIALVDSTGTVTFKADGNVRITAEAEGSGVSAWVDFSFTTKEYVNILDPDGNDITGQTITLQTAEYQLKVSYWIPNSSLYTIEWFSSDENVAEVDYNNGFVVFKKAGTVQIDCSVVVDEEDGTYGHPASVTLCYDPQIVTIQSPDGYDITGGWVSVDAAEYQLNASASHSDPMPEFIWTSSNTDVAEVDQTGKVTFRYVGIDVTITVTADDGSGSSATVELCFDPPEVEDLMILDPDGDDVSGSQITVYTAEYQLGAEAYPPEAFQQFTWSSSDTDIAEVDQTGKVTFKEAWQEVTITAEIEGRWYWRSADVVLTFAASSGTCGVNTAYLISDGTITFSGNGSGEAVWGNSCRAILDKDPDIRKIVFSDTVRVTDASYMFSGLSGIEEMNLAKLDVSGAEYYSGMFEDCSSLTRLNVSGWDTSNAQNMSYMFYDCSSLESLDLSTWDTSGVESMYMMFYGCTNLSRLNVSGWNTSNVYNMTSMFYGCRSLESLDLSGWDTFNVTRMSAMFSNCSSLRSLNVSGWNTSGVTNMANMFENCYLLDGLDVSGWNTSRVTNMYRLFMNCRALTGLDVSGWDVSKVTNISSIFNSCHSLISLDVSKWNTSLVKNMGSAFANCRSLKELNVSDWDTSRVTSFGSMFWNCFALTALDAGSWNTSQSTAMNQMFYNCTNLSSLNVSGWDTSQVTTMYQMFFNCGSLDSLDLSGWNPVNVTNLTDAFYGCYNISTLTLGKNTLQRNIFTALPKYYASWYYIQPGSSASSPLKTGTEKKGVTLFTGYDSNTMAGTWSINKNQKPLATAVKIQNSGGTDITGKTITSNALNYQLKAAVSPAAAAQTVTWKSSDTAVAAVDKAGKVTFKKAGTVTITAAASDGSKKSATVKLKLLPAVTAIVIRNSDGAVVTGKSVTSKTLTYQLKASATPAGAAQTVTWKSSDTAVAAVDKNGKVTFKKAGTVTITATSTDRGKRAATVKLTLLPKATKIIIRDPKGNKVNGKTVKVSTKTFKLSASALPAKAEQTVTWKSSDTSIATVNKNGKVTFKKAGIVKITVRSTDRGKKLGVVKLKYAP